MLLHRSGYVACGQGQQYHSNFGCNNLADVDGAISTYVTVGKGLPYALAPYPGDPNVTPHVVYGTTIGGWYVLSGYNSMSPYLVFNLPQTNERPYYCFEEGTEYQLWYGEDMTDWSESNDGGTAYTDIYIMS